MSTYQNDPKKIDAFKKLYERQYQWQTDLYNKIERHNFNEATSYDKVVDENLYNAIEEIIEARRHINCRKYWNPEKTSKRMSSNQQFECAEEIIDVFHFLMTALIYLDMSFEEIEQILLQKMNYNNTREDHLDVA